MMARRARPRWQHLLLNEARTRGYLDLGPQPGVIVRTLEERWHLECTRAHRPFIVMRQSATTVLVHYDLDPLYTGGSSVTAPVLPLSVLDQLAHELAPRSAPRYREKSWVSPLNGWWWVRPEDGPAAVLAVLTACRLARPVNEHGE
jgi:hypothetical protein